MAEKLLVELQDDKGNIFYLHTSSAAVFCADGKTVQEKIGTVKGRITTKENLKLVTEANYLPEAKAVKDYFDELNGKIIKKTVTFTGTIAPKSTVSVSKDFTMDAGYQYLAAALGYVSNIGALCACCNYTQNKVNLGIYNNHSGNLSYEVSIVISEIKL